MIMAEQKPRLQFNRQWYKGILCADNDIPEIEQMDIREDDVWVCSFPRSGTTLTQELVYLIVTGDFDKVYNVQLDERFPIIEVHDERYPYYKGIKFVEEMTSPRLIKSHLPNFLLPEQLRAGKGKIIYICRNPKDMVASFYRMLQWTDELPEGHKTFELFVEALINGQVFCGKWTQHVLGYWENNTKSNVLFLKFEEVVKDLPKTIRQIAEFLNKDLTDEQIMKISDYCQFDNMKNNDKCNMSYYRTFKHVNDNSEGGFMNKGKTGTWREVLSQEIRDRVDAMAKDLDGSGLVLTDR